MQEFLVIAAIILALFFLPRLTSRKPAPEFERREGLIITLSGWMRLAILVTVFWIAGLAVYLQPWKSSSLIEYLYISLGPAIAAWGAFWVWCGYKHHS
ncbi:MAG: hypothetical protein ABFD50_01875 [Smithella sp.]